MQLQVAIATLKRYSYSHAVTIGNVESKASILYNYTSAWV